jgi:hypothetical protein
VLCCVGMHICMYVCGRSYFVYDVGVFAVCYDNDDSNNNDDNDSDII